MVETLEPAVEPRKGVKARKRRAFVMEVAIVAVIALLLLIVIPPLLSALGQGVRVNQLGRYLALAIAALGIDLIWGYTGLLSLGHGIFFALGGYALGMYLQLQLPAGQIPDFFSLYGVSELPAFWQPFYSFPFTLLAIWLIPTLVAAALGYLVFRNRIRGVYFSILTQAALIVFFNFFNGQQKLINGTNGLKTDTSTIFGMQASDPRIQTIFYVLSVLLLVAGYALCRWLTSGRMGRMLVAIRDDEPRVRFSGYNPTGFKVFVFAISAALAGIAGALYTVQSGIITPSSALSTAFSIEMVIWVAVGGRATLVGAIFGTLLVNFAKTLLSEQFPEIWLFFQGALFLAVVTILPNGIIGWLRTDGWFWLKSVLGRDRLSTYPSLETDPEVEYERENSGD
ncbi:MAG TPA: urea ABC transporter permease subunit UrtC [Leptolyngbyaceae cyanobacterium M33_DOE_097]|uniref:Urea ABC transporter permease subunit UrtC n=1 Tax=Oscillatoriales cyanobacterium SpSt-418 TaxID=2282169 RepID=A0A7C3P9W2_9CYAN|nr:urea ABC transporter permease subunit UrtC [Leptolyngbyaceae cyanobacterium M33_DOE_097]